MSMTQGNCPGILGGSPQHWWFQNCLFPALGKQVNSLIIFMFLANISVFEYRRMQILTAYCFIVSDMAQSLKALSKMALCVFCSKPTYSNTKSRNLSKPLAL